MALLCSQGDPMQSLSVVGYTKLTLKMHPAQVVLRLGMAMPGGILEPLPGFVNILRSA